MHKTAIALGFGLATVCVQLSAPAQAPPPGAPPNSSGPPVSIKLTTNDIVVGADGLYTETQHLEIMASTDAAANRLAQQTFNFADSTEELDITDAYTLKADGRRLPVDPSKIFAQSPPTAAQAPLFSDLKSKVAVFPDVAAHDTIVFTLVKHSKETLFPGQFMDVELYPRLASWGEVRTSITAPKSLALHVETHDLTAEREVDGDKIVYKWHYTAPDALAQDVAAVSPVDREPRYFVSSFKSYDDLGHAYAASAIPKAAVTAKIQSLADEITAGSKDHRDQAEKLYNWVSRHIRYVGIELGRGRVVPHDADAVVANGYGDCKDHVAVYAALLKAKGIKSEMALINLGNSYVLPEVPTLAQLNHVITWLPEFKLYVDTTASVAPFGTLPFAEYGKPVVHALERGSTLHKTPLLPQGQATMSLKTQTRLNADGSIHGDSVTAATGSFSFLLRQVGNAIEAAGPERAVQGMMQQAGLTGSGGVTLSSSPSDPGPTYSITVHFDAQPRMPLVSGQAFPMPPGIRLLPFAGDFLMGPLYARNLPATQPTPCWSGSATEDLSIEPPPGKHFARLPQDSNVTTDHLSFTAHWSQSGRTVSVHREFKSNMDQELCSGAVRKTTADALFTIAGAYPLQISLADD